MPMEVCPHADNARIGADYQAATRLMWTLISEIAAVVLAGNLHLSRRARESGRAARSGKERCLAQRFIT
jgi:hypothetical protein